MRKTSLTLVAVAALALIGCSSQQPSAEDPHAHHDMGDMAGISEAPSADANEADIMFVAMMIPHHEQALEMSDIVLAKPDLDPEVRALAEVIKNAQGPEIEQMNAWLEAWGANAGAMGDHAHHMDGMLTPEQLDALRAAGGAEASDLFLEQMIAHHEGALTMAEAEARDGSNPDAVALAKEIITSQQAEIDQMKAMLAK